MIPPETPLSLKPRPSPLRRFVRRIIFGLLFVLPILLTVLVFYQIYVILNHWIIEPVALLLIPKSIEDARWTAVEKYVTPPITLAAILLMLYLLGYAFQTRLNSWIDWIFGSIPGVSILYRAIREASLAIHSPDGLKTIDSVVLVPFPHPGARATGYLMGECQDASTGRPLACVYIPIGLFPPSGYTLVVPREDITITNWEATSPWKLLLSGGLTVPAKVPFDKIST